MKCIFLVCVPVFTKKEKKKAPSSQGLCSKAEMQFQDPSGKSQHVGIAEAWGWGQQGPQEAPGPHCHL